MVDFRDIKYCCIGIEINKFELKKKTRPSQSKRHRCGRVLIGGAKGIRRKCTYDASVIA